MGSEDRRIRMLLAKTSLDGHWRGVAVVATALRNAGMEVIYGGQLTAEQIASAAMEEDVDVVGLNIGGSFRTVENIMETLKSRGLTEVLVVAGGTVTPEDVPKLKQLGIAGVFPPGSRTDDIIRFLQENVRPVRL